MKAVLWVLVSITLALFGYSGFELFYHGEDLQEWFLAILSFRLGFIFGAISIIFALLTAYEGMSAAERAEVDPLLKRVWEVALRHLKQRYPKHADDIDTLTGKR